MFACLSEWKVEEAFSGCLSRWGENPPFPGSIYHAKRSKLKWLSECVHLSSKEREALARDQASSNNRTKVAGSSISCSCSIPFLTLPTRSQSKGSSTRTYPLETNFDLFFSDSSEPIPSTRLLWELPSLELVCPLLSSEIFKQAHLSRQNNGSSSLEFERYEERLLLLMFVPEPSILDGWCFGKKILCECKKVNDRNLGMKDRRKAKFKK